MQEGKVNYFIGNDSKKWRTNIPTYTSVRYKEIYKGIDIKFYGNNNQMEYDIIVKPGGDPNSVQLAYEGIEGLKITKEGNLEIALKACPEQERGNCKIIQKKPVIYQEINGEKVAVDGKFKIHENVIARSARDEAIPSVVIASPLARNDNAPDPQPATHDPRQFSYTFEVASYNKSHALIIDPVLVWSTYLGGSGDDGTYADCCFNIAVDASGNAYITGGTSSRDFPIASPIYETHRETIFTAFVTKIDTSGNNLVYSTYLGGSCSDGGTDIAIDTSGNAYITGITCSSDFPIVSPIQNQGGEEGGKGTWWGWDAFITKIDAAGSNLVYSTYLGGGDMDFGYAIAVDTYGNAYITGATASRNFPTVYPIQ